MPDVKTLALASLVIAAALVPACADNSVSVLRDTEGLATGRFPAMNQVDCVVPYCIHNPDGSLNAQASYEALVRAQNYGSNTSGRFDISNAPRFGVDRSQRERPGTIPGAAIAARLSAPPASTAPQVGLFSVLHNVER